MTNFVVRVVVPTQEASGWNGDLKIFFLEKKNSFRCFVPRYDKEFEACHAHEKI